MRLSLSAAPGAGDCERCERKDVITVSVVIISEGHSGEIEPICLECFSRDPGLEVDVPMRELAPGPAPRRKALKRNRRISNKQEVELAASLGGRTQPGSGNQPGKKGDVRKRGEIRLEAKFTCAETFQLPLHELEKIAGECTPGEKPIYVIDFLSSETKKLRGRYAVVPFDDHKELYDAARPNR